MKLTLSKLKKLIKEEITNLQEEKWMDRTGEDIEKKGHEGIFKEWCKDNGHGGVNQACINAAYKAGKPWKARAALAVSFSKAEGGAPSLTYPETKEDD